MSCGELPSILCSVNANNLFFRRPSAYVQLTIYEVGLDDVPEVFELVTYRV
jgi:hypothetical protein